MSFDELCLRAWVEWMFFLAKDGLSWECLLWSAYEIRRRPELRDRRGLWTRMWWSELIRRNLITSSRHLMSFDELCLRAWVEWMFFFVVKQRFNIKCIPQDSTGHDIPSTGNCEVRWSNGSLCWSSFQENRVSSSWRRQDGKTVWITSNRSRPSNLEGRFRLECGNQQVNGRNSMTKSAKHGKFEGPPFHGSSNLVISHGCAEVCHHGRQPLRLYSLELTNSSDADDIFKVRWPRKWAQRGMLTFDFNSSQTQKTSEYTTWTCWFVDDWTKTLLLMDDGDSVEQSFLIHWGHGCQYSNARSLSFLALPSGKHTKNYGKIHHF